MDFRTFLIILLALLLALSIGTVVFLFQEINTKPTTIPIPNSIENPTPHPSSESLNIGMQIDVYYVTKNHQQLAIEKKEVTPTNSITERIQIALEKLIQGPRTQGLITPIPVDTELESVFWSELDGRIYVSFSEELVEKAPGHALSEWATIYCIVNTVAAQSPAIKDVQILVGGEVITQRGTLWDWSMPFQSDDTFLLRHTGETP